MTNVEVVSFGGWRKCVRLWNREIEVIVTTQVGPRVIRCGFIGGPNEFHVFERELGQLSGTQFTLYGGHRLWIAPEQRPRTYHPDNQKVTWAPGDTFVSFKAPSESTTGIQKELRLSIARTENCVAVTHVLTNHTPFALSLAAWAVTIMAPGGRALLPQEPHHPHPARLAPARPLVLWPYTDMTDARWSWGKKYIQFRHDPQIKGSQKIGALNSHGWIAYVNLDRLFVKRFPYLLEATYPDFNSNVELYGDEEFVELESLSPLRQLHPGESLTHEERWYLFQRVDIGRTDADIDRSLKPYLASTS